MNFFSKNKASPTKAKRGQIKPGQIETLSDSTGQRALAFGLAWRSLVTTGGSEFAAKTARSATSTHYIFRAQQVGHGKLAGKPNSWPKRLFPASVIAARHLLGDALCILKISENEFWVALLRNGSPTAVDWFLSGVDAGHALEEGRKLLLAHAEDGSDAKILVHTNIELHGFDSAKTLSVYDLLEAAIDDEELLRPVPKAQMSTPRPVLYLAGLMIVSLAGQEAWKWWRLDEAKKLAARMRGDVIDPASAWDTAMSNWQAVRAAPNPQGLDAPRQALAQLPVRWEGWILSSAKCSLDPLTPNAAHQSWSCGAAYKRSPMGAPTREMPSKIPANWSVSFTPLNEMTVAWRVEQSVMQFDIAKLQPVSKHRIETTSQLQALQQALSTEPKFVFAAVEVEAPKNQDGTRLAPDPRYRGLMSAVLQIQGPLRSIDAVANARLDIAWDSLSVSFEATEPRLSLRSSALMAQATGTLYANQ